jgi:FtsH-binding integral membrane protein
MLRSTGKSTQGHGFGIVVLAIVLVVFTLVNMWLRAPLIAQVLGTVAYTIAFAMSMIAACVAVLVLDEDSVAEETRPSEAAPATVEVPVPVLETRRRE